MCRPNTFVRTNVTIWSKLFVTNGIPSFEIERFNAKNEKIHQTSFTRDVFVAKLCGEENGAW